MKKISASSFLMLVALIACSQALLVDSNASVFVAGGTVHQPALTVSGLLVTRPMSRLENQGVIALRGDIACHGMVASIGFEELSGQDDQEITLGHPQSSFGTLIKNNAGNVIANSDITVRRVWLASPGSIDLSLNRTGLVTDLSDSAIIGYGPDRFFEVGDHAGFLARSVADTGVQYVFPVGYGSYYPIMSRLASLGATGPAVITATVGDLDQAVVAFDSAFATGFSQDPASCFGGTFSRRVAFNCLGSKSWNLAGPHDYQYQVWGTSDLCGLPPFRMLHAPIGQHDWTPWVGNTAGMLADELCGYSDWNGTLAMIPGGTYAGFPMQFSLAGNEGSVLPVEITALRAGAFGPATIRVSWTTAIEITNDGFSIERSTDAQHFIPIGFVPGAGTTTTVQNYAHDDHGVFTNVRYYYRLISRDYDGMADTTSMVSAMIGSSGESALLYPNPTTDKFSFKGDGVPSAASVRAYNFLGQEVPVSNTDGTLFSLTNAPAGPYRIHIDDDGTIHQETLIKY